MIDIIIPAYNAYDTIEGTLDSIATQDFNESVKVYIVDDCSEKTYDYLKSMYNLDITIYRLEKNSGPGVARQYGIDHSNSKFIVFIDADDILLGTDSLNVMYKTIGTKYDVGVTSFMEQMDKDVKIQSKDSIWMHGKIYKRSYLVDNNIRFNDSRQNEDYGFNKLLILSEPQINYSDTITYLWQNNMNSITRINNYEYCYTGLFGYVYNAYYAISEAYKRGYNHNLIGDLTYEVMLCMYFYYLQYKDKNDINKLLLDTKDIIKMYDKVKLSEDEESKKYKIVYDDFYNNISKSFMDNPVMSFDDFINYVILL